METEYRAVFAALAHCIKAVKGRLGKVEEGIDAFFQRNEDSPHELAISFPISAPEGVDRLFEETECMHMEFRSEVTFLFFL